MYNNLFSMRTGKRTLAAVGEILTELEAVPRQFNDGSEVLVMSKHDFYREDGYAPSTLIQDDTGVAMRREYVRVGLQRVGRSVARFTRQKGREVVAKFHGPKAYSS